MARPPSEAPTREEATIYVRRIKEARRSGMTRDEARVFALDDSIDVGALRRLVAKGCPAKLLAEILL